MIILISNSIKNQDIHTKPRAQDAHNDVKTSWNVKKLTSQNCQSHQNSKPPVTYDCNILYVLSNENEKRDWIIKQNKKRTKKY